MCKSDIQSYSRGVIYFISNDGLHVDLKGKMKHGFFEGKVYNFSRFPNKVEFIRELGLDYYNIKLKTYKEFKEYQQ